MTEPVTIRGRALELLARPPLHVVRLGPLLVLGLAGYAWDELLGGAHPSGVALAVVNFWVQLAIMVVCAVLSYALAPKPPEPPKPSLDDFSLPTAEEGRAIPVVFGTVWVSGPNVLWYGDLRTTPIRKSSK